MSTPALIALNVDDEFVCITVNWNGTPERVGETLRKVFNTDGRVIDLMDLGNCSSIFGATDITEVEAYHRDKNERWEPNHPMIFDTLDEAASYYSPIYSFVWDGETWTAYKGSDKLAW